MALAPLAGGDDDGVSLQTEDPMRAKVGDHLIIKGHVLHEAPREGEILEVGENGEPPFKVRWSDDGHESTLFPGPDAIVRRTHRRVNPS
jgi:hypothetical protein